MIPSYAANGIPTLVGGGAPIDGGRVFSRDNRRVLGDGKTWRGFYSGMVAGILLGIAEFLSEPIFRPFLVEFFPNHSFSWVGDIRIIICAFLLSFGALLGDIIGSFFKRRINLKRGQSALFLDQLGFLVVGLFLVFITLPYSIDLPANILLLYGAILLPVTFVIHISSNLVGYFIGIQDVPL